MLCFAHITSSTNFTIFSSSVRSMIVLCAKLLFALTTCMVFTVLWLAIPFKQLCVSAVRYLHMRSVFLCPDQELPPVTKVLSMAESKKPKYVIRSSQTSAKLCVKSTYQYQLTDHQDELNKLRENGPSQDICSLDVHAMTSTQVLMTLHSYLDNVNTICRRKVRLGALDSNGYEVCDDLPVRPYTPCLVYSFNPIQPQSLDFEEDVATVYKCEVYNFIAYGSVHPTARSTFIRHYRVELHRPDPRTLRSYTFREVLVMMGHDDRFIDIVKLHGRREQSEIILEMAKSGELNFVRQLLLDIYLVERSSQFYLQWLEALQELEKAGFKKFYSLKDEQCATTVKGVPVQLTDCYQVSFLKR